MDRYDFRRISSWIARQVNKGKTWEQILAINAARKAPFALHELSTCYGPGCQAVRNADLINAEIQRRRTAEREAAQAGLPPPVWPPLRACDMPGCKFPPVR